MAETTKIKRKREYLNKKTKNILIIIIVLAIIGLIAYSFTGDENKTIKVSGAFALYPMMNIWAEEYQEIYPDIEIEVSAGGAGKGMSDAIRGVVDIGMVSREIYQEEIDQDVFWVSVAKDAVVATINKENPVINDILTNGLTKEQLKNIFIIGNITTWGQLVGDPTNNDPIRVYTRSDACGAADTWAKYLGTYTQDDFTKKASGVNGDPGLAGAVKGDKLGIGYNNINFAYDSNTKNPFEGLKIVPLDLNEDGMIDEDNESFYDTIDDIVNAIAEDKYPSPPARALYLVTKNKFTGITKDFINWILTDGQQYVSQSGYIQLSEETISEQLEYLEQGSRPETS
jgi:phosphate transport system substrate-binding protein